MIKELYYASNEYNPSAPLENIMTRFRVCTYNIHKGLSPFNLRAILSSLKTFLHSTNSQIVMLQEVIGSHTRFRARHGSSFIEKQFEFLADTVWSQYAYGKNAVYPSGDHGNALLSKYEIKEHHNYPISVRAREKRGLLYSKLLINNEKILHCFNTHLNLRSGDRKMQIKHISEIVNSLCDKGDSLILAGDFNDWRNELSPIIKSELNLDDTRLYFQENKFATFPSTYPLLSLDRIYFRGLKLHSSEVLKPASKFLGSDHLPLIADFEVIK